MSTQTKVKKLVFGYRGGEKSVLTVEDMSQQDVMDINEKISTCKELFVQIVLPTLKNDILLINKPMLLFFYASDVVEEEQPKKKVPANQQS